MNIKCLVISGGGPTGLLSYGAIKSTHIRKMWTLEELDSIYVLVHRRHSLHVSLH